MVLVFNANPRKPEKTKKPSETKKNNINQTNFGETKKSNVWHYWGEPPAPGNNKTSVKPKN
jgi:hypothetical protein